MGTDIISFLENPETNASYVHAIKASSFYVYGETFSNYLTAQEFITRLVFDIDDPDGEANRWQCAPAQAAEHLAKLPPIAQLRYAPSRFALPDAPRLKVFGGIYREITPMLDTNGVRQIGAHLLANCEPNDDIRISDYRAGRSRPTGIGYASRQM